MKQQLMLLFSLFFIVSSAFGQEAAEPRGFRIWSPAFENNGQIPAKYTCDGANVNPPIEIENVPREAKSLALVFDDVDAPRGSYVHWIVWNIDPGIREIRENSVPEGSIQGLNDFKKNNYGGPCPPGRAHRYVFKFHALDAPLRLSPNATKADLEKAMQRHVIAEAQLTGIFKKRGPSSK